MSSENHYWKIIISVLFFNNLLAQDTVIVERTYIHWVSQYPLINNEKTKVGVFHRITELVAGKKNQLTLSKPVSVMAINTEEYLVLDQGNQTILKIKKNEVEVPRCLKKKENYFTSLVGMCAMKNGEILFTDSRLNKIFLMSADKKKLKIFTDSLVLKQPTGIAFSKVNNEIWVVETNAHRIAVLNENGELKKTIGSRGSATGEFNYPTFIWIDESGRAYIVDAMNFRIQILNKDGKFVSTFGENGDATGNIARPKGIATDSYGNIYVADALFHTIQIFDSNGNFLYQFGKQGSEKEEFWMPAGIFIDDKNYIYVADSYNSRVQIFQLIDRKDNEK